MLSDLEADQQLQEYSLVSAALQQQKTDHGTVILNKDLEVLFANLSGQEHLGIKQQHGLKYLDLDCRLRDALQAQLQQRDDSAKLLPTLQYKNAEVQFSSQFCERAKDLRITLHTRTQNKTETLQERIAALNLTRRETALAELVSQGLTNAQISYKLNISIRTVENHLRSVYAKAGVHNRTSLAYTLTQAH
jgi:DNA-binding CsgD family transcriptional regulator